MRVCSVWAGSRGLQELLLTVHGPHCTGRSVRAALHWLHFEVHELECGAHAPDAGHWRVCGQKKTSFLFFFPSLSLPANNSKMQAPQVPLDQLTCGQLQYMLRAKTGEVWMRARKAVADNEVCGAHLAAYVESAASLGGFFAQKLGCTLTVFVAEELLMLVKTARPPVGTPTFSAAAPAGSPPLSPSLSPSPSPPASASARSGGSSAVHDMLERAARDALRDLARGGARNAGSARGHNRGRSRSGSGTDDDDDDDDGDGDAGSGRVLFRCTDATTGETHMQSYACPPSAQADAQHMARLQARVRDTCAARFAGHEVEVAQVRAGMPKLDWQCVATNARTGMLKEFVMSSKDDNALSDDPAVRQRFVRSIEFDIARESHWAIADTNVQVVKLMGLDTPKKYTFLAVNRATGATTSFSLKTCDADYEFKGTEARQAAMVRLQTQYANQHNWAVQDTCIYSGKAERLVCKVTNTATGEIARLRHTTIAPDNVTADEAAALREGTRRSIEAEVANTKHWPLNVTRAEFVDEPAARRRRTFPYVAHNQATGQKLHLSVVTYDARPDKGTPEQKSEFWRQIADETAVDHGWPKAATTATPMAEDGCCIS